MAAHTFTDYFLIDDPIDHLVNAAKDGNLLRFRELVEKEGVDLHGDFECPLQTAVHNNQIEIVRYILNHDTGVDPAVYRYILGSLATPEKYNILRLLLESGMTITGSGIHMVFVNNFLICPENVRLMLDYGASPDEFLSRAVKKWKTRQPKEVYDNCEAIVKLALEYGADASKIPEDALQHFPVNPRRVLPGS